MDNPCKQRIKQMYLKKYRDLLNISKLQVQPIQQKEEQFITPEHLDCLDKLHRLRSKSLKPTFHSMEDHSLSKYSNVSKSIEKSPSRIYKANEMIEIIKRAQNCGLIHNQAENEKHLMQNRQYFKNIRDLQNTWHYQNIRQRETMKQFDQIPMIEHLRYKKENETKLFKLEDIIYEYPKQISKTKKGKSNTKKYYKSNLSDIITTQ